MTTEPGSVRIIGMIGAKRDADYYDAGRTTLIIRGFDPLNDASGYGKELIPMLRESVAKRGPSRII